MATTEPQKGDCYMTTTTTTKATGVLKWNTYGIDNGGMVFVFVAQFFFLS
jgi:hypothetical protein